MTIDTRKILLRLKDGSRDALAIIYKQYREEFIHWSVSSYSLSRDEAKDVYQTAIIIFYENILSGHLSSLNSSVKTYLFAIGKNKIREKLRRSGQELTGLDTPNDEPYYEDILADEDEKGAIYAIFKSCLNNLGDPCKSVLVHFYYKNFTMAEIADVFEYKNEATAKNSKYKCLQRLKACVFAKTKTSEDHQPE